MQTLLRRWLRRPPQMRRWMGRPPSRQAQLQALHEPLLFGDEEQGVESNYANASHSPSMLAVVLALVAVLPLLVISQSTDGSAHGTLLLFSAAALFFAAHRRAAAARASDESTVTPVTVGSLVPEATQIPDAQVVQAQPLTSPAEAVRALSSPDADLRITVNGKEHIVQKPSPSLLLADFLRCHLGLTGTKVACGEGGCGACTVIAVGSDGVPHPINSCLRLLCACDGLSVTTVEGLGSCATGLSHAQRAIVDGFGSQCGFCTPGWVTAVSAMLARSAMPGEDALTQEALERALDGNLCRCTGYRPILQAFKAMLSDDEVQQQSDGLGGGSNEIEDLGRTACHDVRTGKPCGRECARAIKGARRPCDEERCEEALSREPHGQSCSVDVSPLGTAEFASSGFAAASAARSSNEAVHSRRDAAFNGAGGGGDAHDGGGGVAATGARRATAAEAALSIVAASRPSAPREVRYDDGESGLSYCKPLTLQSLWQVLSAHPHARLVCANTAMGVSKYYTDAGPTGTAAQPEQCDAMLVDVSGVGELCTPAYVDDDGVLSAGAAVSIAALIDALHNAAVTDDEAAPAALALARHLGRVATTQVRAVASWAGNIALSASSGAFPSDLLTLLAAADAMLLIAQRRPGPLSLCPISSFVTTSRTASQQENAQTLDNAIAAVSIDGVSTEVPAGSTGQVSSYASGEQGGQIIVGMRIPLRNATVAYSDKVSQRHANAHAIVNAAFWLRTDAEGRVEHARVACGGVLANSLFLADRATAVLRGRLLSDQDAMRSFVNELDAEARALGVDDGAQPAEYRLALLRAFAYKLFLKQQPSLPPALAAAAGSLAAIQDRPLSVGHQHISVGTHALAPLSMPLAKVDARVQATGEAKYASDFALAPPPPPPARLGVLCGATVVAWNVGATLRQVNFAALRSAPGVVDVLTAADFPDSSSNLSAVGAYRNYLLPVGASVAAVGAPVALVLADTMAHARFAAKLAQLRYDDHSTADQALAELPAASARFNGAQKLLPSEFAEANARLREEVGKRMGVDFDALARATHAAAVLDGDETAHSRVVVGAPPVVWKGALPMPKAQSSAARAKPPLPVASGADGAGVAGVGASLSSARASATAETGVTATADESRTVLRGSWRIGGQRHFYLETNCAVATPTEDGIDIVCSTQNLGLTQHRVAAALKMPLSKVECRVKHVGGAYGGKLAGGVPTAVLAAVAAAKHGVAVRMHAERADDMTSTGGRAPVEAEFTAVVESDGIVKSMELDLALDGGLKGYTGDLAMAIHWSDNCYRHADFACKATAYKSARPNNAACRAPGVVNSVSTHELVMEIAAEVTNLDPEEVRERNFYREGDTTPFGTRLGGDFNWSLPQLWDDAKRKWDVAQRRARIEAHNKANTWRKRGISMIPIKYNMAGQDGGHYRISSSVRVLRDGSVQLSHGGVEIGQGIHTKAAQAAAHALGCDVDAVTVAETSSDQCPHSTSTGGSGTSEMSVLSVLDACAKIRQELDAHRDQRGWLATVKKATSAGCALCATGWTGWSTDRTAEPFAYATYGVAAVEIELDVLTGELQISRADLMMDQGVPLNPAVDLGQAEGAFVMALGLFFSEEIRWADDGRQLTLGTWEYKIPAVHDIPLKLNVEFAPKMQNPSKAAVKGSKASGEPPFALGFAAFLAARHAIKAARADAGDMAPLVLDSPLTPARIQQACLVSSDRFTIS